MIVLALVGLGVASYLTYVHYAGINPVCTAGGSCLKVQTSAYSKLAGVPVALMGLIGYVAIMVSLLAPRTRGDALRHDRLHHARVRLQRLPHLPRALLDPRDLRVVRLERGHHDDPALPVRLALPARRRPPRRDAGARRTSARSTRAAADRPPVRPAQRRRRLEPAHSRPVACMAASRARSERRGRRAPNAAGQ